MRSLLLGRKPPGCACFQRCLAISQQGERGEDSDLSNEKTTSGGREVRGVEMARHLARHDIKVDIKTTVASDIGVTDAILSYVADSSATMIVMGGYGHSRLREFILGGATRGILSSMTVPVLMSH